MTKLWALLGRDKPDLRPKMRNYLLCTMVVFSGFLIATLLTDSLLFIKGEWAGWSRWERTPLGYFYRHGDGLSYWCMVMLLGITVCIPMLFRVDRRRGGARRFLIVLAALSLLVAGYFLWASHAVFWWSFSSPAPIYHPGRYLPVLHDWIDRQHPLQPGYLKYHGEIFRLKAFLGAAACLSMLVGMIPVYRLANSLQPQDPRFCQGCGYDLQGTKAAGRSECPECGSRVSGQSPLDS